MDGAAQQREQGQQLRQLMDQALLPQREEQIAQQNEMLQALRHGVKQLQQATAGGGGGAAVGVAGAAAAGGAGGAAASAVAAAMASLPAASLEGAFIRLADTIARTPDSEQRASIVGDLCQAFRVAGASGVQLSGRLLTLLLTELRDPDADDIGALARACQADMAVRAAAGGMAPWSRPWGRLGWAGGRHGQLLWRLVGLSSGARCSVVRQAGLWLPCVPTGGPRATAATAGGGERWPGASLWPGVLPLFLLGLDEAFPSFCPAPDAAA